MDEAEQHFIGLSGFFGFRLVHNAHHFINTFRQKGKALHFVDVVSVLVSFSPPVYTEQVEKKGIRGVSLYFVNKIKCIERISQERLLPFQGKSIYQREQLIFSPLPSYQTAINFSTKYKAHGRVFAKLSY